MMHLRPALPLLSISFSLVLLAPVSPAQQRADPAPAMVNDSGTSLQLIFNGRSVADYVYAHDRVRRPFFANVQTPAGIQATRNFPPIAGRDATDHDTMHPGIWLAFGDINGVDFWRNRGRVEHLRFDQPAVTADGVVSFVERKRYLSPDGTAICQEQFRCQVQQWEDGILFAFDSTFFSDHEFYFGDQEEMGLGIRVATPLTEENGGTLGDSENRSGADQIWSQAARWCDYRGTIGDQTIGMAVLCHPDNFRSSWMHARDYGLIVANPFGRAAMNQGPPDKTVVQPGKSLRLRYGVIAYSATVDVPELYQAYLALAGN